MPPKRKAPAKKTTTASRAKVAAPITSKVAAKPAAATAPAPVQIVAPTPVLAPPPPPPAPVLSRTEQEAAQNGVTLPKCKHNKSCKRRTSRTSKNSGRIFYSCPEKVECGHFRRYPISSGKTCTKAHEFTQNGRTNCQDTEAYPFDRLQALQHILAAPLPIVMQPESVHLPRQALDLEA